MEETQPDNSLKTFHVVSDAGGNVTNLIESHDDGSLTMANSYEYGPFGQVVTKTEAVEMPYQFNTKYTDSETGLVYYGYRFYDSADGRWLNRDPIGLNGGINIYNSVSNNMVNGYNGGNRYGRGMEVELSMIGESHEVDAWGYETSTPNSIPSKHSIPTNFVPFAKKQFKNLTDLEKERIRHALLKSRMSVEMEVLIVDMTTYYYGLYTKPRGKIFYEDSRKAGIKKMVVPRRELDKQKNISSTKNVQILFNFFVRPTVKPEKNQRLFYGRAYDLTDNKYMPNTFGNIDFQVRNERGSMFWNIKRNFQLAQGGLPSAALFHYKELNNTYFGIAYDLTVYSVGFDACKYANKNGKGVSLNLKSFGKIFDKLSIEVK